MQLVVSRVELYEQQPDKAPGWFAGLYWEDVLVGLLLHEYAQPQNRPDGDLTCLSCSVLLAQSCCCCTCLFVSTLVDNRTSILCQIQHAVGRL